MRILALLAAAMFTAIPAIAQSGLTIPHQFVIRVESFSELHDVLEDYGLVVVDSFPERLLYLVAPGPSMPDRDDEEIKGELDQDDRLILHEQNRENCSEGGHTQSFFVSVAPVDFVDQPAFEHIGLRLCPVQWTGQGVTVAILDTGVSAHAEYRTQLRNDGASFIDDDPSTDDIARGLDTNLNDIPDELAGHGTFMAGLIAHVAPGCQILPIRVLDSDGVGNSFAVAAGIYYAIDHGAEVINLSLSSPIDTVVVHEAIQEAIASGRVVVASVGNTNSLSPQYPAANAGVVAVAACDLADHRMPTSDYGAYVMFSAPGKDVVSTFLDNSFASASGTSVSTALVSGSIARMHSRLYTMSATSAVQAVSMGSVPMNNLNRDYMGWLGRSLRAGTKSFGIAPGGIGAKGR